MRLPRVPTGTRRASRRERRRGLDLRKARVPVARYAACPVVARATAAAWSWRVLLVLVVAGALLWLIGRLALVTLPVFAALVLSTLAVPPAPEAAAHVG
jgi:fatty acid desaturase